MASDHDMGPALALRIAEVNERWDALKSNDESFLVDLHLLQGKLEAIRSDLRVLQADMSRMDRRQTMISERLEGVAHPCPDPFPSHQHVRITLEEDDTLTLENFRTGEVRRGMRRADAAILLGLAGHPSTTAR